MKDHILSVKEKIGYGMGDAASHIIFDNVMLYMMFFYTDIFGIPAGFVGTMFLLARALDAISDPCMGLLADRTRSRWGKFRPWILFGAIPFGLVCVLAYSSPDLSHNGKLIYAAVTYTLLTLLYTVVNIPYCALGGALIGWMLAGGGYDAAAKTQNSATLTIIIALFTLVPAVCYLLSAVIAKRYYTLKTPFLKKMMAELAEGARRNEQDFTAAPIDKEWQN
ncbi:MFS transporter [Klebsiella pneumoniae]|uniref:MFS transporter n=1 Tax=Klebsiella pneumoniae TaxID=573 RepID=UPI0007CD05EB|nr:MFS transporter [Klebsiella pneumoniae]EKU0888335.1 MFS transporter [Klebsiella pneumoniae]EKW3942171.1 MFS transporter [Klebsiella pneumoniae]EKX7851370.1 MFS transporter [Klebsiella pneumoniae]MCE0060491.1 MFS transporter [Klebsiella pneumoniae]MDK5806177.1 MFS transporter [Klebsiella pneumoniae]